MPLWAKLALGAVVAALAISGHLMYSVHQKADDSKAKAAELDPAEIAAREPVGAFSLIGSDGKPTAFDSFKGNVVVLSFWASWCGPCLSEMPTFAQLEGKFKDQGLRVVAVNVDEDENGRGAARDFWKSKGLSFPTFFDLDQKLQSKFQVDMLPSNLVIDRGGRVAFRSFGANDWSNAQTQDLIEQLLQEPVHPPAADAVKSEET